MAKTTATEDDKPSIGLKKSSLYIENISEATAACLFTMVQGNLLLLGLSHWLIASQTGIVAGVLASVALTIAKTNKRWLISMVLGCFTGVVDFFIHPGMIGGVATEAIITGIAAGLLSYVIGAVIARLKNKRTQAQSANA